MENKKIFVDGSAGSTYVDSRNNNEYTLHLILRSVYLKATADAFNKKVDLSWEDEIIKKIYTLFGKE